MPIDFNRLIDPMNKRTFSHVCVLGVEVGTNTPRGGDSGHGGRTVVRLVNDAGCDMHKSTVNRNEQGDVTEIVLAFGGDAEAHVLADALIWAGRQLKLQAEDNRTLNPVVWPDVLPAVEEPFWPENPTWDYATGEPDR